MHISSAHATHERGQQERIGATLHQQIDIASCARLAPGIRAEEPRAVAEPIGPGALKGRAYLGQHGRAASLRLSTFFRHLFLEVRPYRATEGAHEVRIGQARAHGQRMTPGITPGKMVHPLERGPVETVAGPTFGAEARAWTAVLE